MATDVGTNVGLAIVKSERLIVTLVGTVTIVDVTTETTTTDGTDDGSVVNDTIAVLVPTKSTVDGGNVNAHESGIATGVLTVDGTKTTDGTTTTEALGNETMVDVTIETITLDGTLSGTELH
jgi:hypothetical protein